MIANAPQLFPGLEMYYDAFVELSTCRDHGLGVGPIPWDAIDRYGYRYGFIDEGFEYLRQMVRALDDVFLAHSKRKAKEKPDAEDGDARAVGVRAQD